MVTNLLQSYYLDIENGTSMFPWQHRQCLLVAIVALSVGSVIGENDVAVKQETCEHEFSIFTGHRNFVKIYFCVSCN